MNISEFWKIIDKSGEVALVSKEANFGKAQCSSLAKQLKDLSAHEVAEFQVHFFESTRKAYRYDLWGAALVYQNGDGCSDDAFGDFRAWMISLGKHTFDSLLLTPDLLGEIAAKAAGGDIFFEEFAGVAYEVYEQLTGEDDFPSSYFEHFKELSPKGDIWVDIGWCKKTSVKTQNASLACKVSAQVSN